MLQAFNDIFCSCFLTFFEVYIIRLCSKDATLSLSEVTARSKGFKCVCMHVACYFLYQFDSSASRFAFTFGLDWIINYWKWHNRSQKNAVTQSTAFLVRRHSAKLTRCRKHTNTAWSLLKFRYVDVVMIQLDFQFFFNWI